jgi:hypothetical protein
MVGQGPPYVSKSHVAVRGLLESKVFFRWLVALMIELNPVRQRIADLQDRLDVLRGYL